jgi:hypothetical protein
LKAYEDSDENKDFDDKIGLLTRRFDKMLRKRKQMNKPLG